MKVMVKRQYYSYSAKCLNKPEVKDWQIDELPTQECLYKIIKEPHFIVTYRKMTFWEKFNYLRLSLGYKRVK